MTDKGNQKIKAEEVIVYANDKACEAVKDMPRDGARIRVFKEAWAEAEKEYVNAHRP